MERIVERVFINPRRSTLQKFIDEAIATIDKRQRARTLDYLTAPDWREHREKSGRLDWNGGSVANAYPYTARSSVLEIVWWVAPNGKRHVRVKAGRILVASYNIPKLIWGEGWRAVYPDRATQLIEARLRRAKRIVGNRGKAGDDDRFLLRYYSVSALSPEGVLICNSLDEPTVAQVVVTCPSTGERHCIGVPPRFVNPKTKTYERLGSEAARIHAAIAWTFNLKPEQYQPQIAS